MLHFAMTQLRLRLFGMVLLLVLTACTTSPGISTPTDGITDGDGPSERIFGTLEYYDEPVQVSVPGTVRQKEPFSVAVTTYGNGCTEKGETKVEVDALRAEVRPYDYDTTPIAGDCTDNLKMHEHTVTLRFEEAGTADVIFFGYKKNVNGIAQRSVTRTLTVR